MFEFSQDPSVADRQMEAIIFYLITFGYIDGHFDFTEQVFIQEYTSDLIHWRIHAANIRDAEEIERLRDAYERRYRRFFERTDAQVADLFQRAVAANEDLNSFAYAMLKLRCYEIFQTFDRDNQEALLDAVEGVILADGVVHPAEERFRRELVALLKSEPAQDWRSDPVETVPGPATFTYLEATKPPAAITDHEILTQCERHFPSDPKLMMEQATADRYLLSRTADIFALKRQDGAEKLEGKQNLGELADMAPFLDDGVYVLSPTQGRDYEIIVLGDLHGCYSCFKAAILQSGFIDKVRAFREDPQGNPDTKLVLLGDYIDRGRFSFNGVLRAVLELHALFPDHVFPLRGNHEYFLDVKGKIMSGVFPAEAVQTLQPHWPNDLFAAYRLFFEKMPHMLILDRTIFVHGGIPRDEALRQHWNDLSALNQPDIRFQMMWSDPSKVDTVPLNLQDANTRFPFGKTQFKRFMEQIGATIMVRGHEPLDEGILENYNIDGLRLFTLFSAGGVGNKDLPAASSYRQITPMALTIRYRDGNQTFSPWEIDAEGFNDPARNAFYKTEPEIDIE